MSEAPEFDVLKGQRHIIERPRLTRLLDESKARIILLVAPAGYGKTTLARQWVAKRPHAWYTATHASADIVALAHGLVTISRGLLESDGAGVVERLRGFSGPALRAAVVADLVAQEFSSWPADAWLVIDDYHTLVGSDAEELVSRISERTPLNLLIASRRRPTWVGARAILYGEAKEIDKKALALTSAETRRILKGKRADVARVSARAEGWPALVGLSARLTEPLRQQSEPSTELYEFLANELLEGCSSRLRGLAPYLAVAPPLPLAFWTTIDSEADTALAEAIDLGIATLVEDRRIAIHPLFQDFLLERSHERALREQVGHRVFSELLSSRQWDAAYSVIQRGLLPDLLPNLVAVALDPLLEEGRLATIERWLATPEAPDSPVIHLARAEVEFRRGHYLRAQVAAAEAGIDPSIERPLSARAAYRAGMSAYFREDFDAARTHLEVALHESEGSMRSEALRAIILIELPIDPGSARNRIREYEKLDPRSASEVVKRAGVRALAGYHLGALDDAIRDSREAIDLLCDVSDPMVRTSFRNSFGHALSLAGRYREALDIASAQLEDIDGFHLHFAMVHTLLDMARAEAGLRRFARARTLLRRAQRGGESDPFLKWNVAAQMAKMAMMMPIALPQGEPGSDVPAYVASEFFAATALLRAVRADFGAAERALSRSHGVLNAEVETLQAWVRVFFEVADDGTHALRHALEVTHRTGAWDTALVSIRARPAILRPINRVVSDDLRQRVSSLLSEAREISLARSNGFALAGLSPGDELSPREREVLALLADGATNRQIAEALFITEATAKAHVRHIFAKLGVRSRVQAARRAIEGL